MPEFIIAVDVGTGSARAGIFDLDGVQRARAVAPISVNQPKARHFEQNSDEIWQAVAQCVRAAREQAGLAPEDIVALGLDATCSLVVRDGDGGPLPVSESGDGAFDTILWMDHRAAPEAEECSRIDDPLLARFGGRLSPEMQIPKLMWLKRHRPDIWARAGMIFDLSDYLTWRATGSTRRSHSPLSSKWGYLPTAPGARPDDFYRRVGLSDMAERTGLPAFSTPPSTPVGPLSSEAAQALGLTTKCIVAPGLIDAYAGAIGVFLAPERHSDRHAALVAGTSSCILTLSRDPVQHAGCWGGFRDAALPGLWLIEAGQSASGALLDHILRMHPSGGAPSQALHLSVLDHIASRIAETGADYGLPITVLPDFHGARSPLTDPSLTGTLAGLTLDSGFEGLCRLYWRACVGLACGIRHILQHIPKGASIDTLTMAGGFANHRLIPELYAAMTGCAIRVSESHDAVLLGAALNAGVAAGCYADHDAAAARVPVRIKTVTPRADLQYSCERDYAAFLAMMRHRDELAGILAKPVAVQYRLVP